MNEMYPFEKEKKLIKLFSFDSGNLGTQYIKQRLKILGINALSEVDEDVQLKIVFDLCYEFYSDILSKKSLKEKIKTILLSLFDKYEVYGFLFWRENFKHDSIEFLYHFFGDGITESLIKSHLKKEKMNNIKDKDEIEKFSFVNTMLYELTKESIYFRSSLISNFIKYLIYGESKSLKLRGFINLNKNSEGNLFLNNIKNYLDSSSKNNENSHYNSELIEIINSLQNLTHEDKEIKTKLQCEIKNIDLNEVKIMLNKYIGYFESNKIINKGLNEFSIRDINKADNYTKKNFVNYIIEKSEIRTYSKQKQKMIKTSLFMILKL